MPYTVTIYVAAPGTPLASGGTSVAGHVYFVTSDGHSQNSFGFAPIEHGAPAPLKPSPRVLLQSRQTSLAKDVLTTLQSYP